jgi:phosphoribosylamine---glycine ligase
MAVSRGYPGSYEKGFEITGLDKEVGKDSVVFHAGTLSDGEKILTNGGRVLCVSSFAETIYEAVDKSRDVLEQIDFDGIYYRRDIGYEFL